MKLIIEKLENDTFVAKSPEELRNSAGKPLFMQSAGVKKGDIIYFPEKIVFGSTTAKIVSGEETTEIEVNAIKCAILRDAHLINYNFPFLTLGRLYYPTENNEVVKDEAGVDILPRGTHAINDMFVQQGVKDLERFLSCKRMEVVDMVSALAPTFNKERKINIHEHNEKRFVTVRNVLVPKYKVEFYQSDVRNEVKITPDFVQNFLFGESEKPTDTAKAEKR